MLELMIYGYDNDAEKVMITLYGSLSEKDRRRYAAVEAKKIGRGGVNYISILFGCDPKTINKGLSELFDTKKMDQKGVRKPGGGPKSTLETVDDIDAVFLEVLRLNTAGDPMKENVKWTNLSKVQIIKEMEKKGIKISKNIVKKLFKKHKFVRRKMQKTLSAGKPEDRNEQFLNISTLRNKYEKSGNPIISIDTKKKEFIGNLYRDGMLECIDVITVFDHDFPHLAEGKFIPYTIYDIQNNEAFVYIGTSHDTSDFVCDAIKAWWNARGKRHYPDALSILCLADSGGSNSSRHHIFKESLQHLSNNINMELRMAHYPPYTSKWNPVEHRVFPHITRSMSGVVLESVELVKILIKKTTTTTGLKVFARISKKYYETGKKVANDFYERANIVFDKKLGNLNYAINPTT
jgi:hypothetical protein